MTFHWCLARTANKSSLGRTKEGNYPTQKISNAAFFAHRLRNCHLEGLADERHYDGSAGIFLVGREHKMPELKKRKKKKIT